MHLVGFTIEMYYDARSYKRQRHMDIYFIFVVGNPFLQFIQASELNTFYWGMKNTNRITDNLKISHITSMPQSTFALCLSANKFVYRPSQIHFRHTRLIGLNLETDGRKENAAADDRRNIRERTTYRSTSFTEIRKTGWGSVLFGKKNVIAVFFTYLTL